jgi:DNA adenine methylase
VFFALRPTDAVLSDTNAKLIATYKAIRDDWASVLKDLHAHARNHSDDYYYRVRAMPGGSASREAARFIYLNRTCWNGLYRVNREGQFNTPRGTRDTVISRMMTWR